MRPSQSAVAIEIIQGGHQNKADIPSALARKWFADEGVDIIVTAAGIAVALAVADIAKLANKTLLVTGALSSRLAGDAGMPNSAIEDGDTSPNGGGTK